ncbi:MULTISPECIES: response regulator transcription factor [Shewanella]|jgi:two-component system response regulator PhoP|uniref:response regulator transcription factor n=1 Tax=Shewanella TaxID=22 RepID=UPI000C42AD1A|nr:MULTISPECIES: response regulator transcription factor [Shewanella]NCQ45565.1 response regulator transcription factor [Shewanella frigidimarina]MBB1320213.1 response regulator transcription factor [Shewanella sp. SR43-8]NCO73466.1 response regulator transcription factor [Shewanella vesiculosa]NCP37613.1 response regulator transcription factor [Shewanella vesiculosa]NCP69343.1 response regulator transcription factor [Shewanella vesiculosa]|tara:strand:- start:4515 stop:5198 length:684 start_codon:yes stop_codon:yes gene_type:complete
MRLLLVEDDLALQQNIKQHLIEAQYTVDVANDGEEGLFQAQEYQYDVAIIDVGLPKLDGLSLISQLREQDISYPIIILTARDSWQDKVVGLDAGADDYLSKPFQLEELVARINALIRRSAGKASPIIQNGPFSINTRSLEIKQGEQIINLSGSEYKLFEYLMLHPGSVHSKSRLIEHIYDQDFDLDSNVIEVFIRRLRKKLDPDNQYQLIETLRGQGYRLRQLDPNA